MEWFSYRYICEDDLDKWQLFFKRLVNQKADKYIKLYTQQMKDFDPAITRLFEETYTGNNTFDTNRNNTNNSRVDRTDTSTNKTTFNTDRTTDSNTDTTSSDRNENTVAGYDRTLFSDTPQSIVSASTTGNPASITWNYATNLTDVISNGTVTDVGSANGNNTEHSNTNGIDTTTGNDTRTGNDTTTGTATTLGKDTTAETSTRNTKETGEALQDLYRRYFTYIKDSKAQEWIVAILDRLFLSTLDSDGTLY